MLSEMKDWQEYNDEGFAVKYPGDVTINKSTPVEDFNVYKFICNGREILGAYVGNQPSFHQDVKSGRKLQRGHINKLSFEAVQDVNDKMTSRQVLISLNIDSGWPKYVHFWYSNLSQKEVEIAEGIINSIRNPLKK
jgi:hypothetical protein